MGNVGVDGGQSLDAGIGVRDGVVLVMLVDGIGVSPFCRLGDGERSAMEVSTDAVSSLFVFFFFRLRGGRFFFSDSNGCCSSTSHLLEANSDSDSPSCSAMAFQYNSISLASLSGS